MEGPRSTIAENNRLEDILEALVGLSISVNSEISKDTLRRFCKLGRGEPSFRQGHHRIEQSEASSAKG